MNLGARLRGLREEKGMTQAQLGSVLGVSGRQVGNYESGVAFPRDQAMLLAICCLFDVSADYLLGLSSLKNYKALAQFLTLYGELTPQGRSSINEYITFIHQREKANG